MAEAFEQPARSEAQWWNSTRSLGDIAEHLEHSFREKEHLERKISELREENNRLARRCAQADSQLKEATESLEKLKSTPETAQGRYEAWIAARERLLNDEFQRKAQELRVAMNAERRKMAERVEELTRDLEGCYCKQGSDAYVVHVNKKGPPQMAHRPVRRS